MDMIPPDIAIPKSEIITFREFNQELSTHFNNESRDEKLPTSF